MKTIKILFAVMLGFLMTTPAQAARLKNLMLTQSNPTQVATGVKHKINTTLPSTTAIHTITMRYCTRAATDTEGVVAGCDAPDDFSAASVNTGDADGWTTLTRGDFSAGASGGTITLTASTDYTPGSADTAVAWQVGGLQNAVIDSDSALDDAQCLIPTGNAADAGTASSATCFIRVTTNSVAPAPIDTGYSTYTVTRAVIVSATVDPTFTFIVTGVNSNVTTYTGGSNLVTTVSSSYSTLPFGNLTANTEKYAAHRLYVTTNTQSGYDVTARLTALISGVYAGNEVDDFPFTWTGNTQAWTQPTGQTPNGETAWFGGNTTDTDIDGGAPTLLNFGGIGDVTPVIVKDEDGADNGTNGTYVTYAMEANVFQPADTYQGTLIYNAVPTY